MTSYPQGVDTESVVGAMVEVVVEVIVEEVENLYLLVEVMVEVVVEDTVGVAEAMETTFTAVGAKEEVVGATVEVAEAMGMMITLAGDKVVLVVEDTLEVWEWEVEEERKMTMEVSILAMGKKHLLRDIVKVVVMGVEIGVTTMRTAVTLVA